MYAYCFRSGLIEFGKKVPEGALPLARGSKRAMGDVRARARLAYDNETYLVPGIPEAKDDDAAYDAFQAFREWINKKPQAA